MIGRTHDESRAVRDLTEFADDKLVAEDRIVEKNLRFFKVLRLFRAVVVGIVANKNIGCRYDIFQKDGCFVLVRKNNVRIRILPVGSRPSPVQVQLSINQSPATAKVPTLILYGAA